MYQAFLPIILSRRIKCPRQLAIDVFSYSSESRLAEQIASIRSFLSHAGRPAQVEQCRVDEQPDQGDHR